MLELGGHAVPGRVVGLVHPVEAERQRPLSGPAPLEGWDVLGRDLGVWLEEDHGVLDGVRSSRTLPGHGLLCSARIAAGENLGGSELRSRWRFQ